MLTMLVMFAILWIALKILIVSIQLPFFFLGFLFQLPLSGVFWLIMIFMMIRSMRVR